MSDVKYFGNVKSRLDVAIVIFIEYDHSVGANLCVGPDAQEVHTQGPPYQIGIRYFEGFPWGLG